MEVGERRVGMGSWGTLVVRGQVDEGEAAK